MFAAVDVGDWLSCGLDPSGVITCWGRNDYGQTDARTERFSSISVAGREVCGVEAETGRFVRWVSGSMSRKMRTPDGEDGLDLAIARPPRVVMPKWHNCYRQMVLSLMDLSRQFGGSIEDG